MRRRSSAVKKGKALPSYRAIGRLPADRTAVREKAARGHSWKPCRRETCSARVEDGSAEAISDWLFWQGHEWGREGESDSPPSG